MKVQGAKSSIENSKTYWIQETEFDRLVNGDDSDTEDELYNNVFKRHMYYKEFLVSKSIQTEPVLVIEPRLNYSSDTDDDTDGTSCFKRFRASMKMPCIKANVSYEQEKKKSEESSPVVRKKARRMLKFDDSNESGQWMSKESGKGKLSCCWSDTDSVDDLLLKYVELEKLEKKTRKS